MTFARGTSIKTREALLGFVLTPGQAYVATTIEIPAGTKGVVREVRLGGDPGEFHITMDFLPSMHVPVGAWTSIYADQIEETLEPLDDNWGQPPRPLGRQHLPASQRSWLKPNPAVELVDAHGVRLRRTVHGTEAVGVACKYCQTPLVPLPPEWAARRREDYTCAYGNHGFSASEVRAAQGV